MEVSIETDFIIMGIDVLDMDIIIIVDIDTTMEDGIERVMDIMDTTQVESTTIVHIITKTDIVQKEEVKVEEDTTRLKKDVAMWETEEQR